MTGKRIIVEDVCLARTAALGASFAQVETETKEASPEEASCKQLPSHRPMELGFGQPASNPCDGSCPDWACASLSAQRAKFMATGEMGNPCGSAHEASPMCVDPAGLSLLLPGPRKGGSL